MVSVKKIVPCKCGMSNTFEFSSDMLIEDITVSGLCASCSRGLHISFSALLQPAPQQAAPAEPATPTESETKENIESAVRDLFR